VSGLRPPHKRSRVDEEGPPGKIRKAVVVATAGNGSNGGRKRRPAQQQQKAGPRPASTTAGSAAPQEPSPLVAAARGGVGRVFQPAIYKYGSGRATRHSYQASLSERAILQQSGPATDVAGGAAAASVVVPAPNDSEEVLAVKNRHFLRAGEDLPAIIPDARTGKKILIPDIWAVDEPSWLADHGALCSEIINVEQDIPWLPGEKTAFFYRSEPADTKTMKVYLACVVRYATWIDCAASLPGNDPVILHCRQGRSRSPSVLLAFFVIYRGFGIQEAMDFLTPLFRAHRPLIARNSRFFPNFEKYQAVFFALDQALQTADPMITVECTKTREAFVPRLEWQARRERDIAIENRKAAATASQDKDGHDDSDIQVIDDDEDEDEDGEEDEDGDDQDQDGDQDLDDRSASEKGSEKEEEEEVGEDEDQDEDQGDE
jgi:hypothetical protein